MHIEVLTVTWWKDIEEWQDLATRCWREEERRIHVDRKVEKSITRWNCKRSLAREERWSEEGEPARRSGRYTSSLLLPGYLLKLFFRSVWKYAHWSDTVFYLFYLTLFIPCTIRINSWSFTQSSEGHGEGKCMCSLFLFFLFSFFLILWKSSIAEFVILFLTLGS